MFAHPEGILIAVGSVLLFHGSVYMVLALNTGWRFAYWLSGASMGALAIILTSFWLMTALGPRGNEPEWVPVAASANSIESVSVDEQNLNSPSAYPGGGWEQASKESDKLFLQNDAVKSAVGACLDATETQIEEYEEPLASVCPSAQALLPVTNTIPRIEGVAVALTKHVTEIRFNEEGGVLLSTVTIRPITLDPRLTTDKDGLEIAPAFQMTAYRDPGSLRFPAWKYFIGAILYFAFHMLGLSRAEKRQLSPVAIPT